MPAVGGRWLVKGGDLPQLEAGRLRPEAWDDGEMTASFDRSSRDSDTGGGESASKSGDSAGDSWILSMLCWLSPLTEPSPSLAAGRIESLLEGPRDKDEDIWPDGLTEPFIVPTIGGRDTLGAGSIEARFVGGSIDFRAVVGGVVFPELDLLEEVDETSCLVGDFFGDLNQSVQTQKARGFSQRALAPNLDTGPGLTAGVGLPEFMLCLFVAAGSSTLCLLAPPTPILGGLPFVAAPFALPFGRGVGLGVDSSMILGTEGLINMPCPGRQSK